MVKKVQITWKKSKYFDFFQVICTFAENFIK